MTIIIKLWTKFATFNQASDLVYFYYTIGVTNRLVIPRPYVWIPSASFKTVFKEQVFRLVAVASIVRKFSCEQWVYEVFLWPELKHSICQKNYNKKKHGNYLKINEISKIAVHEFNNFLVSWTILCTLQVSTFYCYCYRLKIRTRNWRLMNTLFKSFTELERVRQFTINYITNGTRWRLSLDTICRAPTEAWQFVIKIKVGSVSFRGLVVGFLSALVHSHMYF